MDKLFNDFFLGRFLHYLCIEWYLTCLAELLSCLVFVCMGLQLDQLLVLSIKIFFLSGL